MPRSFRETTDISEYPHRGTEWCAATAPFAPRQTSRLPQDRRRCASQCDAVRYATSKKRPLHDHHLRIFVWLAMHSGMEQKWRSSPQGPVKTVRHGIRFEWLSEQTHGTDSYSSCFQPRLWIRGCHDHGQAGVMS